MHIATLNGIYQVYLFLRRKFFKDLENISVVLFPHEDLWNHSQRPSIILMRRRLSIKRINRFPYYAVFDSFIFGHDWIPQPLLMTAVIGHQPGEKSYLITLPAGNFDWFSQSTDPPTLEGGNCNSGDATISAISCSYAVIVSIHRS